MLYDSPAAGAAMDPGDYCDLMIRLFNKASRIEREPVDTGDGILLYTSEVHLIDIAGRFPDEGLSACAGRLGITKGAVSQSLKKLEEKGYVERINSGKDNRAARIRLTETGVRVFAWHRAYHAVVSEKIGREISGLSKKDRETIRKVFRRMEDIFDDCPAIRNRITREMFRQR